MRKFIVLLLVPIFIGCAGFQITSENQTQRIGVKATTMVLIDKGYIEKEKLEKVVDLGISLLGEDTLNEDIDKFIKEQIGYKELTPPAKLAVDEFLLSIKDNVSTLVKDDTLEEKKKQTLIVLGWVKDAIGLYN